VDVHDGFREYEAMRSCPACHRETFARVYAPDIARCATCGVYFRNPRPTQAEIKRSYDADITYTTWEPFEQGRHAAWVRRLGYLPAGLRRGRLLDVGTGDGHFLAVAAEAGIQAEGTEVSEAGVHRARLRGQSVRLGDVVDLPLPLASFDIVTLWHVLEHVPDVGRLLGRCRELLRDGGLLVVATPNEENRLFRHRVGMLRGSEPLGRLRWGEEIHLVHFQPATLRSTLQRHGFQVLRFGVDDIYDRHTWPNRLKLTAHRILNILSGWHFSMAMYAVARKPET
jgi:2-polyprenyl-3-methyl-5-hydroxy-6-metoxy-1,4-benzoquinol methylase